MSVKPCSFNKSHLRSPSRSCQLQRRTRQRGKKQHGGREDKRTRERDRVTREDERRNNAEVMKRVRRGETGNLMIDISSLPACPCVCVCVCARTSGVLAYRSVVLSCVSTCICVCVCLSGRSPWGLRTLVSDQSAWTLTDPPVNTSWRTYLYQCFLETPCASINYF